MQTLGAQRRRDLIRWLTRDGLTYSEARARALERWGVSVSIGTLSNFYSRHCAPVQPAAATQPAPLLDVVIQSTRPIRLRILHCAGRLTVITQPARAGALRSRKGVAP